MASARLPSACGWWVPVSPASSMPSSRACSRRRRARRSPTCTTTWRSAEPARQIRRIGLTTKSDRRVPVAIVGGGASGTILAAQLARRGIRSLLIDGGGRMGRGVAYSTTEPAHLLNVRAEGMSALAGEPDHFARRFEREGGSPRGFAQRRFFATYLGEILSEAVGSGCADLAEATAVNAAPDDDGW